MEASRIARDYKENDSESYVVSSSFSDFEEPDRVAPREFVGGLFPSYSKLYRSNKTLHLKLPGRIKLIRHVALSLYTCFYYSAHFNILLVKLYR